MPPPNYIPKYVPPNQAAENRARLRRILYWTALALPLVVLLLMFGYSDQAPPAFRNVIVSLDRMFGSPVLNLISWLASH